ncbi:flagellar basal-body MS-ring/collar protein FliF [Paracoccus caeni]|uniref:flagellar basal-body MS-ring/collar protein FliF n=1 Tax=Paracoccus caeni TaxID=657651 RepID=UPI001F1D63BF|nr:flagellar basal-body MS-ring/collar protein FliF [Paracoccus caeni]
MQKLQDYWGERSARQRAILIGAFLSAFLAIAGFGWLASRSDMAMIYGGLDTAQAGEVMAGLDRSGVAYEVRGDSIWVDAAQRDRLRMDLAAQGLPASGSAGYELLDGMSGFGTTSQMFDAAYWRAKEGELARTILALPNVKTARVHLAVENARGYRRDSSASASATLSTNGAPITREQADALRYLISSAVPGMKPDSVTVIDTAQGIIATSDDRTGTDRAAEMKRNVERILEPHVGTGNAIVELNLDLVTESELLTEQSFDPAQRALISQVTEETSDQSNSNGSGMVTAASNLPDGQSAQGDNSQSTRSENRQQANYEVGRTTREVTRQPGATRRLTVAVLLNGVTQQDANGDPQIVPRPDTELEALRELVASAVGFDESRGDQITVKSLPFASIGENGTLAATGFMDRLELNSLVRLILVGLFMLAIALLILRPVLRARNAPTPLLDDSQPIADTALSDIATASGSDLPRTMILPPEPVAAEPLALPSADPVARLRSMMRDRHEESVKVLAGWIDSKENA